MSGIVPDRELKKSHPHHRSFGLRHQRRTHRKRRIYLDFIQACHDATLLRDDESIRRLDVTLECPRSQGFAYRLLVRMATEGSFTP